MKKIISIIMVAVLIVTTAGITASAEKIETEGYLIFDGKPGNEKGGYKWEYMRDNTIKLTYIEPKDVEKYKNITTVDMQDADGYDFDPDCDFIPSAHVSENFFDYMKYYKIYKVIYGKNVDSTAFFLKNSDVREFSFNGTTELIQGLRENDYIQQLDLSSFKCIRSNAFFSCDSLEKVILGNTKTIGNEAFKFCKSLKTINFPKTLTRIGYYAFYGTAIEKLVIPNSVTSLDAMAFQNCKKLKYAKIGDNVTCLKGLFTDCSSLEKVVLGKKVSDIMSGSLYHVHNYQRVKNSYSFMNCKKLSSVTLENTKKAPYIEKHSFKNTKSGIKFYVKNKTVAKGLKKNLKGSGVKNARIYIGKKLIYKNVK